MYVKQSMSTTPSYHNCKKKQKLQISTKLGRTISDYQTQRQWKHQDSNGQQGNQRQCKPFIATDPIYKQSISYWNIATELPVLARTLPTMTHCLALQQQLQQQKKKESSRKIWNKLPMLSHSASATQE
jgi:hypothetical protein